MFKTKNMSMKSKLARERRDRTDALEEKEAAERLETSKANASILRESLRENKTKPPVFSIGPFPKRYDEEGDELYPEEKVLIKPESSIRYNESQRAFNERVREEKNISNQSSLKYNEINKLIGRIFEMYIDSRYVGDYKYKGEFDDLASFECVYDCNNYSSGQPKVIPISELTNYDSVFQFINLYRRSGGGRSRKFLRKIRRKSRKFPRRKSRKSRK